MPNKCEEIKATPRSVVFITQARITRWLPDPGNPKSVPNFLDDCRRQGWPIFDLDGTSYVYATEVAS